MIDIKYYQKCRNIRRLSMMNTIRPYNLMEHQWMVGMLFRQYASIEDVAYDINVWDIVLNHDLLETVTNDLPWPIKNFSDKTQKAWSIIEKEFVYKHFQLARYSDENIKSKLNTKQFALFKACDTLDLFIFCKEEQALGNNTKEIHEVITNCNKIFYSLDFQFPNIKKFIDNYA